jgi:hypothetical protein
LDLFLRLGRRFGDRFFGERNEPLTFLLEPAAKIVGAVFKKHDKAEGEKDKKDEPEEAAKERHDVDGNLGVNAGQSEPASCQLPV